MGRGDDLFHLDHGAFGLKAGSIMSDTATIYLPFATDVVVKGFTNAGLMQRITLAPETGSPIVFVGTGEQNTPIGRANFTTPAGTGDFTVVVTIENSQDGNSWSPSDIYVGVCAVRSYNLAVVVSEDMVDEDYNDAICMLSWPQSGDQKRK
jgi:hypothetical protein